MKISKTFTEKFTRIEEIEGISQETKDFVAGDELLVFTFRTADYCGDNVNFLIDVDALFWFLKETTAEDEGIEPKIWQELQELVKICVEQKITSIYYN